MKIDTTSALVGIDGETIKDQSGELTLRRVIQTALLSTYDTDVTLTGSDKVNLWKIANAANEDEVEWSPEDVATIRARIGKGYGPAVVGPAFALLD